MYNDINDGPVSNPGHKKAANPLVGKKIQEAIIKIQETAKKHHEIANRLKRANIQETVDYEYVAG